VRAVGNSLLGNTWFTGNGRRTTFGRNSRLSAYGRMKKLEMMAGEGKKADEQFVYLV